MIPRRNKSEMIHALLFASANGIPFNDALADYPIPPALKQRLVNDLESGQGLARVLGEAGFPSTAAESLAMGESLGMMSESLEVQQTLDGMRCSKVWPTLASLSRYP
jgi:type II secretory pathway component PulF